MRTTDASAPRAGEAHEASDPGGASDARGPVGTSGPSDGEDRAPGTTGRGGAEARPATGALAQLAAEYEAMGSIALTDDERWPGAGDGDRAHLTALLAEPGAPRWTHRTGDRLTAADLAALACRDEAARIGSLAPGATTGPPGGPTSTTSDGERASGGAPTPDGEPAWVRALVERAHAVVPRYRASERAGLTGPSSALRDLPLVSREDLVRDVASYVPIDVPLDRVLEGSSSGSVGAAIHVPLHPVPVAADLLALHALVERVGVPWRAEPDRLALALLVDQERAFTYASLMQAFPGSSAAAGGVGLASPPLMARVNLDPRAWASASDRDAWLARHDPQVVSTSTLPLLTLLALAERGLAVRPLAVVNGATHLTPAARDLVLDRWGAPVVDVYGLREVGLVAWAGPDEAREGVHRVLPRRVHVEVVDEAGRPVPDGVRGEVVVTVEENPYLPLLRYRTGDTAALRRGSDGVLLVALEGRHVVLYRDAAGRQRPSVEATQLLQACGLLAWHLHQDADGGLTLLALPSPGVGRAGAEEARDAVADWLGRDVELTLAPTVAAFPPGKPRRFSAADRAV